jgi:hypothetical protein
MKTRVIQDEPAAVERSVHEDPAHGRRRPSDQPDAEVRAADGDAAPSPPTVNGDKP